VTHFVPLKNPREAVLWLAVHHQQRKALELFAMEIASAGTSMGMCFMSFIPLPFLLKHTLLLLQEVLF